MPGLTPSVLLATWERATHQEPVEQALTLLAAVRAGAVGESATIDVASRDVLLAQLLEATAGALVWARAACGSCGGPLDVPVDVAAVARLPVHQPGARFVVTVAGAHLRFRLPTTADLLALRGMAPGAARRLLLARCLDADTGAVSNAMAEAVDAAMERTAPAGAIEMVVGCPYCGARTRTALDLAVLLWAELEAQATALINDVHVLAAAYGWTEAEILALTPRRRAAYLELAGT